MKKIGSLFLALLLLVSLAACGAPAELTKESILGAWTGEMSLQDSLNIPGK